MIRVLIPQFKQVVTTSNQFDKKEQKEKQVKEEIRRLI